MFILYLFFVIIPVIITKEVANSTIVSGLDNLLETNETFSIFYLLAFQPLRGSEQTLYLLQIFWRVFLLILYIGEWRYLLSVPDTYCSTQCKAQNFFSFQIG